MEIHLLVRLCRNLNETVFSMIKRKPSKTVSARDGYRQLREMIVRCIAHNVEQFLKQLYDLQSFVRIFWYRRVDKELN